MPDLTPNLQLEKPTQEEFYDVDVQNRNMDIIDQEIAKITDEETGVEAKLTTHLNQISYIGKNKKVILSSTAGQSILPNNVTKVVFNTQSNDFNSITNNVITISEEGYYDVSFSGYFNAGAVTGVRSLYIYKNESVIGQVTGSWLQDIGTGLNISKLVKLGIGDTIEFRAFQNSGNAILLQQLEASVVRVA
ncbi:hypothetical protein ACTHOQ_13910 [Solibacillus silvestris]|uniref:hypothetical protein n=1 Tax=Solibacillus silvestris TaxID=76853 RepID=UPI003F7EB391